MNFFYSININDRVKFPILGGDGKSSSPQQDPDTTPTDTTTEPLPSPPSYDYMPQLDTPRTPRSQEKLEEDSYFEAFKSANCEKGLYCDEILKFLDAFFQRMRGRTKPWRSLQAFLDSFNKYVQMNSNELRELMDTMNTKRLITPYIELDLPVNIIEAFNQLDEDDPRINLYQLNPIWGTAIKEFGFFCERYESTNEVLCLFVWSKIDHALVPMPAVGLNPYPLCWVCDKGFGTLACPKCRVAKYCSKECRLQDSLRHGGPVCELMASSLRKVRHLSFKRPANPATASSSPPSAPSSAPSSTPSSSPPRSASPSLSPSPSPSPSPPRSPPSRLPASSMMEVDVDVDVDSEEEFMFDLEPLEIQI